jgi:hypothetical protein
MTKMNYAEHRFELLMIVIYGACCFGMGLAINVIRGGAP